MLQRKAEHDAAAAQDERDAALVEVCGRLVGAVRHGQECGGGGGRRRGLRLRADPRCGGGGRAGAGDDLRLRAWAVHRTPHRLCAHVRRAIRPHTFSVPAAAVGAAAGRNLDWGHVAGGAVHPEVASEPPLVLERASMAWGDKLVEYYSSPAQGTGIEAEADADSSPESEDEEEEQDGDVMIKVGKTEKPKISDELAELGFYARFTEIRLRRDPPPPRSLASYPTRSLACAASFPAARAYPPATSTRWRARGHIPALNWQRYDAGMQLNEGLFVGSPGWVLKPARLRDGTQTWMGKGFRGSGWWAKSSALAYSAYVYAELLHFEQDRTWSTKVTQDVPGAGANVLWNERFEWEFAADDLAFLRSVHPLLFFFAL
ncbi:hypothetical protein B0H14DRAFT_3170864 [Mycena olivaceomarginata]|nr:hypothetical protein B0H14DRAFT_3170864 [Mycena olivaceomarginata]